MAWLKLTYQPTALFSLKPSWATSTGGKSLLLPSPYAFKMGLLDAAIRTSGLEQAKIAWPMICRLDVGIQLPDQITVTNLFGRILREKEIKTKKEEKPAKIAEAIAQGQWPFQHTIGFREYVYFRDPIVIAVGGDLVSSEVEHLKFWALQLNYLGKRGGLIQLLEMSDIEEDDLQYFVLLTQEQASFNIGGLIQQLDDCDPKMKFEEADIYNTKRPKRITRNIVIPYQIEKSSRSYTLYALTN